MHLPEHRADAAHLEHEPLQRDVTPARRRRDELPGLLPEIHEDRPGLHHRERLPVWTFGIDDRRNLAVRVERDELGRELVVLADVDRVDVVRHPELFEHDGHLAAVGGAPGVEVDHRISCFQRN
jgi:hypothetical protein